MCSHFKCFFLLIYFYILVSLTAHSGVLVILYTECTLCPAEFSAYGTDAVLRPKGKLNENSGRSFVLLFSLGHHRLL